MWRFDLLFFVMIECRVLLFMSFVSDIFILVLLLVVIIMLKVFIDFTSYFYISEVSLHSFLNFYFMHLFSRSQLLKDCAKYAGIDYQ